MQGPPRTACNRASARGPTRDSLFRYAETGGTISLRIWPDAEHSFDRPELPVTLIPDGAATPACPVFYLNDAGVFFNYRTGEYDAALTELEIRRDVVGRFPRIGVPIGSRGSQP